MFFCEECRQERHWPESIMRSSGPCEICGKSALCYDIKAGDLPPVPQKKFHLLFLPQKKFHLLFFPWVSGIPVKIDTSSDGDSDKDMLTVELDREIRFEGDMPVKQMRLPRWMWRENGP